MIDELGERMKSRYENRTRYYLPRRTYTIIRIDGKAFHSYTRGCNRPFDNCFIECMDRTGVFLAENIQGTRFCFVQSDEISLVLTDFESNQTDAWYDGNLQKIVSVSASLATMSFNKSAEILGLDPEATFDARAFTIPDREEVMNYFVWRQQDATRNSIQAVAQSYYSPKELHGKNSDELQEMIHKKGKNWNDYEPKYKRGRAIIKHFVFGGANQNARSNFWVVDYGTPIFTQNRDYLGKRILYPVYDEKPMVTVVGMPHP